MRGAVSELVALGVLLADSVVEGVPVLVRVGVALALVEALLEGDNKALALKLAQPLGEAESDALAHADTVSEAIASCDCEADEELLGESRPLAEKFGDGDNDTIGEGEPEVLVEVDAD